MPVTLANGQTTKLHMTPGNIMVFNQLDIEPTLPMGLLVERLGCKVDRGKDGVQVQHPYGGLLHIRVSGGCPQ